MPPPRKSPGSPLDRYILFSKHCEDPHSKEVDQGSPGAAHIPREVEGLEGVVITEYLEYAAKTLAI